METAEVVVIGGGVMGLSAAWRLASAGRQVVLLEQTAIGNEAGSSHGPTRIFRFAYDDPAYVVMAKASLPLWRELEGGSRKILKVTGGLDVGAEEALARCRSAMDAGGAAYDGLTPAEVGSRFPWLRADGRQALYSPDTGVLVASEAVRALAAAARAAGTDLREHSAVRSLKVEDDAVALGTDDVTLRAGRVVLAAGAWLGPLAAGIGISAPLTVTREQVFYYEAPTDVVPVIFRTDVLRYVIPKFGGSPGVKVAEHMTGARTTAGGRSFDVDDAGQARVDDFVRATFPPFGARVGEETCLYTSTPDEDFVLDVRGPLVILSPCSGHGFKFAPLIREIAACLATGREPPVDVGRFALARFH